MSTKEKHIPIQVSSVVVACFVFNILFLGVAFVILNKLPPIIPLYYGAPAGHDQLSGRNGIFLPTIITLSGILINILFSTRTKDKFLYLVFQWSSVFLTFLSFYTTVRIILLIGNFH